MKKMNQKGFTLAELLIVVAVIAVLVAVAIPTFTNQLEKSRQAVDVSNLRGAFAAARIAEMDGSVDNVPFKTYERHLRVGVEDETADNIKTNVDKKYASYWYDPDSGKLIAITNKETLDSGYHKQTKDEASPKAMTLFTKTSQKGKATGSKVLVDTKQLPGEGEKIVVYQDDQLERYEAADTNDTTVYHTGTVDKAIRVTFYHTKSDTFKLHEISFVMFANSPLYTEGMESEIIAKLDSSSADKYSAGKLMTTTKDAGAFSLDLNDIKIGGLPYDDWKELYTVEAAKVDEDDFDSADLSAASDKVTGTLKVSGAGTEEDPKVVSDGEIILTFTAKDDFTLKGTLKVKITNKTT